MTKRSWKFATRGLALIRQPVVPLSFFTASPWCPMRPLMAEFGTASFTMRGRPELGEMSCRHRRTLSMQFANAAMVPPMMQMRSVVPGKYLPGAESRTWHWEANSISPIMTPSLPMMAPATKLGTRSLQNLGPSSDVSSAGQYAGVPTCRPACRGPAASRVSPPLGSRRRRGPRIGGCKGGCPSTCFAAVLASPSHEPVPGCKNAGIRGPCPTAGQPTACRPENSSAAVSQHCPCWVPSKG
mmetsp:Transcript_136786/g.381289  ORF Transcript_136786/g.381289 Transcript_136786/m.381289 type:complete len:241 (+) Transcript_136786:643-1365(+)